MACKMSLKLETVLEEVKSCTYYMLSLLLKLGIYFLKMEFQMHIKTRSLKHHNYVNMYIYRSGALAGATKYADF